MKLSAINQFRIGTSYINTHTLTIFKWSVYFSLNIIIITILLIKMTSSLASSSQPTRMDAIDLGLANRGIFRGDGFWQAKKMIDADLNN